MPGDNVQEVGARMVLTDAAKFKAGIDAATKSLKAYNDEQARAAELSKDLAAGATDSAAALAEETKASRSAAAAAAKQSAAQDSVTDSTKRSVAGAAAMTGAWKRATKASTEILKYSSVIFGAVAYEGIKNYMNFQQMMAQGAIDAGIKTSQLPALSRIAIQISNQTGLAAAGTNGIADAMYRLASSYPGLHLTTNELGNMTKQVANLAVAFGQTGDLDSLARMYGAVVSNRIPLTAGGPGLSISNAKELNEWALAVTGHGDVKGGDLVSALGTGILSSAKTYGLSLNELGAAFDVLSPAMNANSAATRLRTAFGLLAAPTSAASQAYELFGGNATTAYTTLQKKGLGGLLGYLDTMFTKPVTGSNFANAFYGSGLGSATGGTKGVGTGAGEYLRVAGFTPAQVAVMESRGVSAVPGAEQVILTKMFGGAREGSTIQQLLHERGTYQTKLTQIGASENPRTYAGDLRTAYAEPIVAFHRFEQQFKNMTITIGRDVDPAFDAFLADLEKLGAWFGSNKWAIKGLLGVAGVLVGGAALIKLTEGVMGIARGASSIFTVLTHPGKAFTSALSGSGMQGAAAEVTKGGAALQGAAEQLSRAAIALTGDDAKLGVGAAGLEVDDAKLGLGAAGAGAAGLGAAGAEAAGAAGLGAAGAEASETGMGAKILSGLRGVVPELIAAQVASYLTGWLPGAHNPNLEVPGFIKTLNKIPILGALSQTGTNLGSALVTALWPYKPPPIGHQGKTVKFKNRSGTTMVANPAPIAVTDYSPTVVSRNLAGTPMVGNTAPFSVLKASYMAKADSIDAAAKRLAQEQEPAAEKQKEAAQLQQEAAELLKIAAQNLSTIPSDLASALSPGNINRLANAGARQKVPRY